MNKNKQKPLRTRDKVLMMVLTIYNLMLLGIVISMAWYYLS